MQDFRKLRVWQIAHELALDVSRLLRPRALQRMPGLRNQAVRAALSVAANIAEGCGRRSPQEFHRFLEMALSSLLEVESELQMARDCGGLSASAHHHLQVRASTLRRMLITLMARVLDAVLVERQDGR